MKKRTRDAQECFKVAFGCYTKGEKQGYLYGRAFGKISFLTTPLHSQIIHNHDTEVHAAIVSCFMLVLIKMLFQESF